MKHRFQLSLAFSLVEVTLALGVAAFCLIAVLGLLPVAVQTNRAATEQTIANGILSSVIADLRATPKGAGQSSKQFKFVFPNNRNSPGFIYFGLDGSPAQKIDQPDADTVFYATVTYMDPPAGSSSTTATLFDVKVSWPYAGIRPPTQGPAPAGFVETFVALDRN